MVQHAHASFTKNLGFLEISEALIHFMLEGTSSALVCEKDASLGGKSRSLNNVFPFNILNEKIDLKALQKVYAVC